MGDQKRSPGMSESTIEAFFFLMVHHMSKGVVAQKPGG